MDEKILKKHKKHPKCLAVKPAFKSLKRGRLPKPLHKMGGGRLWATDMLPLADAYQACFIWRDGGILSDTAFFGWLFETRPLGLYPLAVLHYHPSHKPVHLLTPCRDERDFTNRQLPGVVEFFISKSSLDPRNETDRLRLFEMFCSRCGIKFGDGELLS